MAFFKLIFLLHCVGLVQLSSYGGANNFSSCDHTNILKAYKHLLKRYLRTSEPCCETGKVINCCPRTKGAKEPEALLSCIHNFTEACVAADYPDVWTHTVSLLEANCSDYIGPKVDNVWNGTITHRKSDKCNFQRKKIIANQECGNHTLQELQMMWKHYYQIEFEMNHYKPV